MTVTLVEKATTRRINDPSISDPIAARPAGDCPGRETDAVQLLFCISFSDLSVSTRSGVVIPSPEPDTAAFMRTHREKFQFCIAIPQQTSCEPYRFDDSLIFHGRRATLTASVAI